MNSETVEVREGEGCVSWCALWHSRSESGTLSKEEEVIHDGTCEGAGV